jgi:hypothetical protein
MRRHLVLAAAATTALLIISGCSSDTGTRRTVTAVVTVSSGAEAPGSAESSPADASGAPASGSADATAASPSPSEATSSSAVAAPIVTVDPLKVDCAAILSPADIKKIYGIDIPNDRLKITVAEVNTDVGQTGRIRCLYGLNPEKTSGNFTVVLTQYTDAAAAQAQVDVTIQNETDNGAEIVPVTVNGYPATVALRDGGLLIMAYDTWTMAIGASAGGDPEVLKVALGPTAEAVLARVLKG